VVSQSSAARISGSAIESLEHGGSSQHSPAREQDLSA